MCAHRLQDYFIFPPLFSFIKLQISLERWRQIYLPTTTKNDGHVVGCLSFVTVYENGIEKNTVFW